MKSKTKTIKKVLGLALSLSICASFMPGALTANAEGETVTSDYTITIPAALTVADSGWNAIGNISATGTLASGKKLTVTASSDGEFALVKQDDENEKVNYTIKNTSEDTEATTSWEFTELSETPATKPIGIVVADYSDKPAGTYQDTVTFTAKVEEAGPTLATALENGATVVIDHCWNSAQRKHTYYTFTNNSGTYTLSSKTGTSASEFNGTLTKNGNTLVFSTSNMFIGTQTINFDTTNNTYSVTRDDDGYFVGIAISVNGTDITSQLSAQ